MPLNESRYFEKAPGTETDFRQAPGEPSFAEKIQTYYEDPGKLVEDFYSMFDGSGEANAAQVPMQTIPPQEAQSQQKEMKDKSVKDVAIENPNATKVGAKMASAGMAPRMKSPYERFSGVNPLKTLEGVQNEALANAKEEALIRQNYANDVAQKDQTYQSNVNRIREDYFGQYQNYVKELDAINNDMKNQKINPSRFWENSTGWQKALMGIGLALSSLGNRDQMKSAIAMINKEIDRDIDAQKYALQQKGNRRAEINNMLSLARTKFADEIQAENAARLLMMDQVKNQMEAKMATLKTGEARQKMGMLKAAMEEKMLQQLNAQRNNLMKQGDMSAYLQSQDPIVQRIGVSNFPQQTKEKMMAELGTRRDLERAIQKVSETYDNFKSKSSFGDFWKTLKSGVPVLNTQEKAQEQAAQSDLESIVVQNWKGPMTKEEAARIVTPLMPNFDLTTSDKIIDIRKQAMIEKLIRNRKPMTFLENLGWMPNISDFSSNFTGGGSSYGKKVSK